MHFPLYDIIADGDHWQVCLVFRGEDRLPIPGKRYTSHEVAKLIVKQMEREDYLLWKLTSLNPQAEMTDEDAATPQSD
jgi:hypothetical protein